MCKIFDKFNPQPPSPNYNAEAALKKYNILASHMVDAFLLKKSMAM